jgi:hypothetical protein
MKPPNLFAIKVNIFKESIPACSWFGKSTVKTGHIETIEGHARGETGGAAVRVFLQCQGITEHAGFSFELIKE